MLENFIDANERQMQHLSNEIYRVGNIALKRHSWKSLRKFNSHRKLTKEHFYKDYPHLQWNFSRNDVVDRPNPKIPPLTKIDEVLFVNDAEQIRLDTFSDADSITSKQEDDPLNDSDLDLLALENFDDYVSPDSEDKSTSCDKSSSGKPSPPSASRSPPGAANS